MKRILVVSALLMVSISSIFVGCGNSNQEKIGGTGQEQTSLASDEIDIANEGSNQGASEDQVNAETEVTIVIHSAEEMALQPTITTVDVQTLLAGTGELIIIDLRNQEAYDRGHIEKAVRIDIGDLEGLLGEGLRNKEIDIVVYSDSRLDSQAAVDLLQSKGFSNARSLGNMEDWTGDLIAE